MGWCGLNRIDVHLLGILQGVEKVMKRTSEVVEPCDVLVFVMYQLQFHPQRSHHRIASGKTDFHWRVGAVVKGAFQHKLSFKFFKTPHIRVVDFSFPFKGSAQAELDLGLEGVEDFPKLRPGEGVQPTGKEEFIEDLVSLARSEELFCSCHS